MSDVIVAPEPGAAPVEEIVTPPAPISTESKNSGAEEKPAASAETSPPEKKLTAREALEAAAKKVDAAEKGEPTDKTKPVETQAQRDEKGKFAPKTTEAAKPDASQAKDAPRSDAKAVNVAEPPSRFSTDAKAAWATAPEPVKAEVHRAIRELDQGVAKYKGDADAYVPFKEFHQLAKSLNVDPSKALREYVTIDKLLGENFPEGVSRIFKNKGIDIRSFAADVLGLPAEARAQLKLAAPQQQQQQPQASQEVIELRREVARLQQAVGGVTGTMEKQSMDGAMRQVAEFAAHPDHALFDELSVEIAQHVTNNNLSLQDAYDKAVSDAQEKARRLGFIPQTARPEPADLAAQTLKGQKSIAGAPSAGSAPATQKPSSSIREALRKAMAAAA